jgi:hypothetical protein
MWSLAFSNLKTDAYLGELGFLEPVDSLFLPLEAENHSPMTTQLSEICDVGQLIYTMHPTAAYIAGIENSWATGSGLMILTRLTGSQSR